MKRFNLKLSRFYPAIQWEGLFRTVKLGRKAVGLFIALALVGTLYSILFQSIPGLEGLLLFSFDLFIIAWVLESFYESKLKKHTPRRKIDSALEKDKVNLALFFDFEASKVLVRASRKRKNPNSYLVLSSLIAHSEEAEFILNRLLIDKKDLRKRIRKKKDKDQAEDFSDLVLAAVESAQERGKKMVTAGDLLLVLCDINPVFRQVMMDKDLYADDIRNLAWWYEKMEETREKNKKFWLYENLLKNGSIGRLWASAYTVLLDRYSTDLTDLLRRKGGSSIVGRKEKIEQAERELSGDGANKVLVVGESGCGRTSFVYHLASRIAFGNSLSDLNYKRVVKLDLERMVSEAQNREKAHFLLEKIFQEVIYAKNIILVVDNIHNFLVGHRRGGIIDLSGIMSKYLEESRVRMIGITDRASFHQKIELKPGFLNFMQKIDLEELPMKETILILEKKIPFLESKRKIMIPYISLRSVIDYADKYVTDSAFPKKAVDLLEEAITYVKAETRSKMLLPEHVAQVIKERTKIPVGKLGEKEKETLLNLEDLIHEQIINQDEAVREVSEALRRSRTGVASGKGPIGDFLFLGPTGVGKTETAKVLAEIYFGSRERMIRLDMSEYQSKEDVKRIVGTKEEEGVLSGAVRERPFSLVLLDEIEKSHPDILHLFLRVLDEGFFTDGVGRRINFKNTIIIGTSNAGYKIILEALEQDMPHEEVERKILDHVFDQGTFRPEFINRFDAVVVFNALSRQNLIDIAGLMLNGVKQRMEEKYITLVVTKELKEKIVEMSYDPKFGAREMERVIKDTVEDALSEALLRNEIQKGDKIEVSPEFEVIKKSG